jgi:predicted DNA-binding protein (MmcQ/YjbR family)
MDIETFRNYCSAKKGVSEAFPFDDSTLVFKVGSKIFALTDLEDKPFRCNLKCDPERAVDLREHYSSIIPGWHMNKTHWNTVIATAEIDLKLFYELIDHSYELVFNSLKKSEKLAINDTADEK